MESKRDKIWWVWHNRRDGIRDWFVDVWRTLSILVGMD